VDTLTGATPTGAIRQPVAQTFTRPSGADTYTIPAGGLPTDDTFKDTRVALTASWQQPWGRRNLLSFGASASNEYDYFHAGINARLARDFNRRNTTVSAGFALSRDTFDPVGGAPLPLTTMRDVGDLGNRLGDQDKDVLDLVVGVSQVVSRDLVVQLNYSYSDNSGYLNDPYKFLSVVDGVTGDTLTRSPPAGVDGPSHVFRFEGRPEERTKHSLYGAAKYNIRGKVLDASYRYMTDDWDIDSHTFVLRYRWPLGNAYIEPHVRYYTQSEADFYRTSLVDGDPLPAHASADYRLGNFDAVTLGLKYGFTTRRGQRFSVRLESYQQRGSIPDGQLFGNQVGLVEYPDLDALIVQFSYHFQR
jgi:opacity protein-like surface antigen